MTPAPVLGTPTPGPSAMTAPFGRATVPAALALLVVAAVIVFLAAPGANHHSLVSVSPAENSTLEAAPREVDLNFDRPAIQLGTQVRVTGPGGALMSSDQAELVGSTVSVRLAAERPAGIYTVQWRVTSADGHPLTGSFHFTATGPAGATSAAPRVGAAAWWIRRAA